MQSGAYGAWTAQSWATTEQTFRALLERTGCRAGGRSCLARLPGAALLLAANGTGGASFSPTPDGAELLGLPWDLAAAGRVAPRVGVLVGSVAEDSDANLTRSQFDLTATKLDFERLVRRELPWANRSVRQRVLEMYEDDAGVPPPSATGRLNASYSRWFWAAKHMLADAEMFCPNRRAARWVTRANRHTPEAAGHAWQFLFAHVPVEHAVGGGAAHNADTAFWFHVERSRNPSCRLNSLAERELSATMARWWLRHAASANPNPTASAPLDDRAADRPLPPFWPPFPADGASREPLMVLETSPRDGAGHVAWNARAEQCAFWDSVAPELTPED